jgi:hypothetical protein
LLADVAGKNFMLLQAFDHFVVERGKFADLVLQDFFYVILSEFAQVIETDETLAVQGGRLFLDELEKRWSNQFRHHSAVGRFRPFADLTDLQRGCSLAHRNFAAELSCSPAICRCQLESTIRSSKISHGRSRSSSRAFA